jgi:hypothetical protein
VDVVGPFTSTYCAWITGKQEVIPNQKARCGKSRPPLSTCLCSRILGNLKSVLMCTAYYGANSGGPMSLLRTQHFQFFGDCLHEIIDDRALVNVQSVFWVRSHKG